MQRNFVLHFTVALDLRNTEKKKNRNTEKHRNKATNLYNKILDTLINLCMTVGQNSF